MHARVFRWMTRYPVEVSVLLAVLLALLLMLVSTGHESTAAERRDLGRFFKRPEAARCRILTDGNPPKILESSER